MRHQHQKSFNLVKTHFKLHYSKMNKGKSLLKELNLINYNNYSKTN